MGSDRLSFDKVKLSRHFTKQLQKKYKSPDMSRRIIAFFIDLGIRELGLELFIVWQKHQHLMWWD